MTETPNDRKTIADLIEVMAALRTPVTGCPWDLEQTFATIAPYTLEEAYEVADAIARGDMADLREELGDLLLQVVYHARMAQEQGSFDFGDVADGITRKMIRRHPHVFGDETARTSSLAKDWWEKIKAGEKAQKAAERARLGLAPKATGGVLGDVPAGMAALTRAIKLQDKAARVGFDWPSLGPVLDKLAEEIAELKEVITAASTNPMASGDAARAPAFPDTKITGSRAEEELGDILFVVANVARHLQIDPEAALRRANDKFTRRFQHIEARLAERGKTPAQSTLDEMDAIWNEVRAADKR